MSEQTGRGKLRAVSDEMVAQMEELQAMRDEALLPELLPWVEEGSFGPMLRHPLVYAVPLFSPGLANRAYLHKRKALDDAIDAEEWHTVVFLHERPYRLKALTGYVIGEDEDGVPLPLVLSSADYWQLAADVWIDSENIEQNEEEWRALFDNGAHGLWLGTEEERATFDSMPDPIPAWRGGTVGDWSWTTDERVARFFSNRSGYQPRFAMIPKADVFGYFARRGESELLVRLTPEREPLVYPNRFQKP